MDRVRREEARVYAFWHSRLLAPACVFRGCGHMVLISRHRDGDMITGVVEPLGYATARGSTTRGGSPALHAAVQHLRAGGSAAFTPDGPRGLREAAQSGAVFAAWRSGVPLLPMGVAARRVWRIRSWDGFRVPQPFTTGAIVAAEPLRCPPERDEAGIELGRVGLEAGLGAANAWAERLVGLDAR